MTGTDRLSEYDERRRGGRTPEPRGGRRRGHGQPRFVVQRHDASTLHFDFRLEIGGLLASWSVPKGPSLDPRDKRLAIRTEDHPIEYATFEGVIPADEYGGGTVIVWDTGTYDLLSKKSAEDSLARGHLKVELRGEKLKGAFALVKLHLRDRREQWLLMKVDDGEADRRRKPARTRPESVLSGRTNEDLA